MTGSFNMNMTFLKSLWRKLFKRKTGSFDTDEQWSIKVEANLPPMNRAEKMKILSELMSYTYDPSQDPERVLRGEVESYFE
jgi:hypothetical protein